jgi:transposase
MLRPSGSIWQRTAFSWRWRMSGTAFSAASASHAAAYAADGEPAAEPGGDGGVRQRASLARLLQGTGHEVKSLPAQQARAYVRRDKTDAADAAALVEARAARGFGRSR